MMYFNLFHQRYNDDLDRATVGDGATYVIATDAQAGTIIRRTAVSIWWQRDKATLLNAPTSGAPDALRFSSGGFAGHTSGAQRYAYERDPQGAVIRFTRRRLHNASIWKKAGHRTRSPGCVLFAGRREYYDFNF